MTLSAMTLALFFLAVPAQAPAAPGAELEAAIKAYLSETKHIDMGALTLSLESVEISEKEAAATAVYYMPGNQEPVMRYRYKFAREDGAWRVASSATLSESGAFPHPTPAPPLPSPAETPRRLSPAVGLWVMLNNFFHDLAVAMFFCAGLSLMLLFRRPQRVPELEAMFRKIALWSFVLILAFGVVRAVFYEDYEWYNAVEHGQVTALVVKHSLFVLVIAAGWIYFRRLKKPQKPG